ncbi:50S ribosomal protein L1 [Candidatus Saccharibacteria bacterium]|nr:50S ribosomal protein L1 [Candidatus Saccharibacteria bacterium]
MAKKAELLKQAKELNLTVTDKNTIAEIEVAIASANQETDTADTAVTTEETAVEVVAETTAKAGKRSAKSIKEAEAKQAKEDRKADQASAEEAPKQHKNPTRSRLERAGKKYREVAQLIEKDKQYTTKEALDLAIKTSPVKFDATVEVHINLNVDPRQADQNLRDNFVLPSGTGKQIRVAVLVEDDDAKAAKTAGADIAGHEDLLKQIEKGVIDFDILIATPNLMAKLGKFARTLGPKGLMPNPKSGTVTTDVTKAVEQAKAGRVEYRVDSTGIVHLGVGKVSFGTDRLLANVEAVYASVKANKPSSIKGSYVKAITISSSMGPGIKVLTTEL